LTCSSATSSLPVPFEDDVDLVVVVWLLAVGLGRDEE
jgi:hypothetical protein